MAKYKLYAKTIDSVVYEGVIDKESTPIRNIPKDTANTDWNEYLEWLKIDGNVPDEAD